MKNMVLSKKATSLLLVLCMAAMMFAGLAVAMPVPASAAEGIQNGKPAITVNTTVIAFAGHEWVVIGDGSSGVLSGDADCVTLLAKNGDTGGGFGTSAFRLGQDTNPGGSLQQWDVNNWFYELTFIDDPNEYGESTLLRGMETRAGHIQTASDGEYNLIIARDIETDGIGGNPVTGQKLWPLSEGEWITVGDSTVLSYDNDCWLRSPRSSGSVFLGATNGSPTLGFYGVQTVWAVRPALYLDLSDVFFTSAAVGGKAMSIGSSTLEQATTPASPIKLTVISPYEHLNNPDGLSLTVTDTNAIFASSGDAVDIAYTGATVGANNSVSVAICDKATGAVLFYGRPGTIAAGGNGTASFDVPDEGDLPEGQYTLKVFTEQVNGDNFTDFTSTPIEIALTVNNTPPAAPTATSLQVLPIGSTLADVIVTGEPGATFMWYDGETGGNLLPSSTPLISNQRDYWVSQVVNNLESVRTKVTAYIDDTVPTLTAGTVTRTSDAAAMAAFTSTEAGTYYWQVDGAAPANAAALVAANTNATSMTTSETISLSSLAAGAHTLYVAAKDAVGNISSNMLTITIPAYVPLAQAGQNAVTVSGGNTYTAGQDFTITATGHRQNVTTGTILGETRYIPYKWDINPSGTWTAPPYTATASIATPGAYTLTVTYRLERWDNTQWVNQNADEIETTQIIIMAANTGSTSNTTTPTGGSPQTGDSSNILLWAVCGIVAIAGLVLCGMMAHKRRMTN